MTDVTELEQQRIANYRKAIADWSDIHEHVPTLALAVFAVGFNITPPLVIELGVRSGVSTHAFLYALGCTGGQLWSVDINPPPPIADPLWHFVQGEDCSQQVLDQLPQRPADIVFVDTDHTYEQTTAEINTYVPRIRKGGYMIFHDTALERFDHHISPQPPFPVAKAIDELLPEDQYDRVYYPNNYGLTVVEL